MTEFESKAYLKAYGLPVTKEEVAFDPQSAAEAARRMGFPVAVKVCSAKVPHKSDLGGVALGLHSEADVRAAAADIQQRFHGAPILVQEMVRSGTEFIVGAQRTPQTGAVLMIGIGGIYAEALDDVVFCRAPTREATVREAIDSLRSQKILSGYRGAPPDRDAVAAIAARLSEIVAANPAIAEVDLNPVIAHRKGAVIADAFIRVADAKADGSP